LTSQIRGRGFICRLYLPAKHELDFIAPAGELGTGVITIIEYNDDICLEFLSLHIVILLGIVILRNLISDEIRVKITVREGKRSKNI